jgi:hypothetical protein
VVTLFHLANALGVSHVDLVQADEEARSERNRRNGGVDCPCSFDLGQCEGVNPWRPARSSRAASWRIPEKK